MTSRIAIFLLILTTLVGNGAAALQAEERPSAEELIADLERKAFAFFRDHRHPETGLVRDRAASLEGAPEETGMCSIASVGYYLTVLPVGAERGWISREEAEQEIQRILRTAEQLPHRHGLFYHFIDWETGQPWWPGSEVSVLDSAIFFNGVITASMWSPAARPAGDRLLERADWAKYVIERDGKKYLSMGWRQSEGLIGIIDVRTSELVMPLLLACGSGKIPVDCYYNTSPEKQSIAGYEVLHGRLPLFVSYYGLGWADLRGRTDRDGVDFVANARAAALANRAFCRTTAAERYATYRDEHGGWWGISAGDAAGGYVAPGPVLEQIDGTVWPMTAIAALPWIPEAIESDLVRWKQTDIWPRIAGRYGLAPFNLDSNWIGPQLIGIDLGAFLVNASNHRDALVHRLWMQHPHVQAALNKLEFSKASTPHD